MNAYDLQTEPTKITRLARFKSSQSDHLGSYDIYFGPTAPAGKESNWLPTDPERRFFLLARFYGPEPSLLDSSFELNDMERLD